MSVRNRRPLLVPAVLVVGAGLALTACGPDNADPVAVPTATAAPTAAPTKGGVTPPTGTASRPATHKPPTGDDAAGGPCDIQNLSIHVTARAGAPNQWVIDVRNTGASACTLSSVPGVDLGNSSARDQSKNIKPVLASGTERFPVPAGKNAYAVIDLDPSGATTGTAPGINELNVLADGEGMPLANIRNFPLPDGVRVLNPHMGIYRATTAEAVTSMTSAGK